MYTKLVVMQTIRTIKNWIVPNCISAYLRKMKMGQGKEDTGGKGMTLEKGKPFRLCGI